MEWVRGDAIGHGSFGTVNLAIPTCRSSDHLPSLMAVKSCHASLSSTLINEKSVLDELRDCPEIVRCFGDCFNFDGKSGRMYNILLEYASGGNLADKIRIGGGRPLQESEVRRYARSVLKGLRYVHEKGFVHCDIKLQNILLFGSSENGEAKIADFGLAKRRGDDGDSRWELRGTPLYMSPEMVAGGEQDQPADIWALGCVVVEMLTGAPAWRCSDLASLLMRIGVGGEVPEGPAKLSDEGKDFVGKCFAKDPTERWTAQMLLTHPFVSEVVGATEESASASPRCPFEFPEWASVTESTVTCSINSVESTGSSAAATDRVRRMVMWQEGNEHDWSVSASWVTVR